MGKAKKTSRKGKKAWRANISTKDVDDYIERAAREERSGGSLDALPNERLFFVDKSSETQLAKKTMKHQVKMLHCDSILERNCLVPPLPETRKRKGSGSSVLKPPEKKIRPHEGGKVQEKTVGVFFDIWGVEDKENNKGNVMNQKKVSVRKEVRSPHQIAAAVEVDAPGCSYNPSSKDHQEALGLAVAQEMQKVYQKELEPIPVPRVVPGDAIDEEDMYFLEVGDGVDWNEGDDTREGLSGGPRPVKVKKLTRAELNRKARRQGQLKLEEENKKQAKVQRDVLRLDEIMKDIENEEQEKQRKWIRRTISKQEKRALGPPRLGKHKFQPEPVQVLLSEEVTGSLRKLKGCYALARERYKSLQRRGILEPRLPVKRGHRKKRVHYEQGTRGQKEREMHAAMEGDRAASKHALAANHCIE